ncbi:hypothetical protein ACE6H2_004975 [Prunus campanulata]
MPSCHATSSSGPKPRNHPGLAEKVVVWMGRKQVAPYPHGKTQPHKALEPQEAVDSGALVNNLAQERG